MSKDDFLKECMSDVGLPPVDQFNATYCIVCANRECSRSSLNNSTFDKRMRNWQSTLFTNVPRAIEEDKRFDNIRSKKFLPMQSMYEVQSISEEPVKIPDINATEFVNISINNVNDEPKSPIESIVIDTSRSQEHPLDIPVKKSPQISNTPFEQGTILHSPSTESQDVKLESGETYILEDD
jgi:hypothetical protein